MRTIGLILFLHLSLAAHCQTVLPYLYYTPPTNGCNGVAAFEWDAWLACYDTGPYTLSPFGCSNMLIWTIEDTLFVQVCLDPCEILFADDKGSCICQLGSVNSVVEQVASTGLIIQRFNGELIINSKIPLTEAVCRLFTPAGQLIYEKNVTAGSQWHIPVPAEELFIFVTLTTTEGVHVGRN